MSKIIGIDISKQTFDVRFLEKKKLSHVIFDNNLRGFKKFLNAIEDKENVIVVMEASGPYYVKLASYLHTREIKVSVVNPLIIRRFSQMKFYRAKTDKKDAGIIREYGETEMKSLRLWQPETKGALSLKQMQTTLELLQKQLRQSKNQLLAFKSSGTLNNHVDKSLKSIIKAIEKTIKKIEDQMLNLCNIYYKKSLELLTSIPCIGNKTAIMLIAITDNFSKFEHYKQLIAYVGLAPRIFQSGTSVRGKGHICKMGKSQIRKLLYMCSWTAKRYNKSCKEMYERLQAKGKPERVIKIAIANKLLKQAFAVATTKQKYIENYQPNICF
ncbi:IS110 family transposase [Flavivirga jejuensis]|uniref:IS110 family transposase n=1 Tax=Flavivirga jejuensis TaxID=870487 RepID=A0ABT8WHZ8_9FLAO|nr:IS110 family transposase [Flavivirga jejuensis]MDO5972782.1 IS110 family transposase [Flavivirga jejuensis]